MARISQKRTDVRVVNSRTDYAAGVQARTAARTALQHGKLRFPVPPDSRFTIVWPTAGQATFSYRGGPLDLAITERNAVPVRYANLCPHDREDWPQRNPVRRQRGTSHHQ
jgi:hypothetical protein